MGALAEDGAGSLPLPGVSEPIGSGKYVRLVLTGARERGWTFEEAWASAINRIQPNGPTGDLDLVHDLAVERTLLEETQPRWRAAFENRDPTPRERAQCAFAARRRVEGRTFPAPAERKAA